MSGDLAFILRAPTASLFIQINHHDLIASNPVSIGNKVRVVTPEVAKYTRCGS